MLLSPEGEEQNIAPDIFTQFCSSSPHIVPALQRSFLDLASPCYTQLGIVLLEVQSSACLPPNHAMEMFTPPGAPLPFVLPVQLP